MKLELIYYNTQSIEFINQVLYRFIYESQVHCKCQIKIADKAKIINY